MRVIQYTDDDGDAQILTISATLEGIALTIERDGASITICIDRGNVMSLIYDMDALKDSMNG